MAQEEDRLEEQGTSRTPPYVSYKTLTTLIEDLKNVGLPPRIDRSVLSRFSGGVGSQLTMALKSLQLVKASGEPTVWLADLVNSYGTTEYKAHLRKILQSGYPFLQGISLSTATPSMFADAFKSGVDAREDVLRKCRTFYLHAAKDAGIEIGPRLEKGIAPRTGNGGPRRKAKGAKADAPKAAQVDPPIVQPAAHGKELEYQLIDLMTEPDIDDAVKQSIWSLVQYLTARKMKRAAASVEAAAS